MTILTMPAATMTANGAMATRAPTRFLIALRNNIIKQQIVKVYTAAGVFLDVWRDAPLLNDQNFQAPKLALNTISSQITITLPRKFDNFDEVGDDRGRGTVGHANIVQVWLVDNGSIPDGQLVYQGYIDGYAPKIDDDGHESVEVTVTPFDTFLGDVKFIGTQNFGTNGLPSSYIDPVAMFNWPFQNNDPVTGLPYPFPLTLDPTNPNVSGVTYMLQFHNQSLSEWNEAVRTVAPAGWYWRTNHRDKTVSFAPALLTPRHTFIVGKHINQPYWQKDYTAFRNDIYVKGTGVTSRATSADVLQVGRHTEVIVEPRIIDQNTCDRYAAATLASLDVVAYRSTLNVVDIRGSASGLGYDIEAIQYGDTCRIQNPFFNQSNSIWDGAVWDTDSWDFPPTGQVNQTVVIVGHTHQFDTVALELASLQPSQDRFLTDLALQFEQSQFN